MNEYRTIQGDTWDIISLRVYGSEMYMDEIIQANPSHMMISNFPAGINIKIPEISERREEEDNMPPWMR